MNIQMYSTFMTIHYIFSFQSLTADLQKFVNTAELPEVLLSVCFNATLCRLSVNVVEGRNIKVRINERLSVLREKRNINFHLSLLRSI